MTQPKFGQIWVGYLGQCFKKKKKKKRDEILAHDLGLTPRSVQVHGLGLWTGISTPTYPAQYLPQNMSAWFMT